MEQMEQTTQKKENPESLANTRLSELRNGASFLIGSTKKFSVFNGLRLRKKRYLRKNRIKSTPKRAENELISFPVRFLLPAGNLPA